MWIWQSYIFFSFFLLNLASFDYKIIRSTIKFEVFKIKVFERQFKKRRKIIGRL